MLRRKHKKLTCNPLRAREGRAGGTQINGMHNLTSTIKWRCNHVALLNSGMQAEWHNYSVLHLFYTLCIPSKLTSKSIQLLTASCLATSSPSASIMTSSSFSEKKNENTRRMWLGHKMGDTPKWQCTLLYITAMYANLLRKRKRTINQDNPPTNNIYIYIYNK